MSSLRSRGRLAQRVGVCTACVCLLVLERLDERLLVLERVDFLVRELDFLPREVDLPLLLERPRKREMVLRDFDRVVFRF